MIIQHAIIPKNSLHIQSLLNNLNPTGGEMQESRKKFQHYYSFHSFVFKQNNKWAWLSPATQDEESLEKDVINKNYTIGQIKK